MSERQRHRIKSRKYREAGRAKPDKNKRKTEPHKKTATTAVNNALRDGRITKEPCMICGNYESQSHHEDYSKPLDVNWLCVRHHNDRHIYLRECEVLGKNPVSIIEQFSNV